jgi:hypothetical protein
VIPLAFICTAPERPTSRRWKHGLWSRRCSAAPTASASDIWCCATNSAIPRSSRRWRRHWIRSRAVVFTSASAAVRSRTSTIGSAWTGAPSAKRSERLGETLEILHQAFANEVIDFAGKYFTVHDMPIKPGPVQHPGPPIVVGGVGEKYTLPLVARYADVWNIPTYALDELYCAGSAGRSAGIPRRLCCRWRP